MTKATDAAKVLEQKVIELAKSGLKLSDYMDKAMGLGAGYIAVTQTWKEHGAKGKRAGFRSAFYFELESNADNALTRKDEFVIFAKSHGASDNDIKAHTHYRTIAELVNAVRAK